jgi:hypothetical protein
VIPFRLPRPPRLAWILSAEGATGIIELVLQGGGMRSIILVILAVGVSALGTGCSGDKAVPNYQAKLDAALAISDPTDRDTALATVAEDAAAAAEPDIVRKAVSETSVQKKRDKTAESAALMLASKGKSAEAVEVARMINDQTLRDRTLSKLTK